MRVVAQQLAGLLHRGVAGQIPAPPGRLFWIANGIACERVRIAALLQRLADLLLAHGLALVCHQARRLKGQERLLVLLPSHSLQPRERAQRLGQGGRLHNARAADHGPPEVWHHGPVVPPLGADRHPPAHHRSQGYHGANSGEIRRTLDALGCIHDPAAEGLREEPFLERGHWQAAPAEARGPATPRGVQSQKVPGGQVTKLTKAPFWQFCQLPPGQMSAPAAPPPLEWLRAPRPGAPGG